ncbi:MAG: alpha/beta fold hydrolase [Streptosporangiaceae bacterium]
MSALTCQELVPVWPGELVDVRHRPMFVRHAPPTSSRAEPAVFVHGLGGGSASWTDLMTALRDRLDGRVPDLPGFGQSPPWPAAYGIEAQADAVAALIERTCAGSVHLFGNSLGGTVATRVAAERPDLVRTLTLISPALPDLRPRLASALLVVPLMPGVGSFAMRRAGRLTPDEQARQTLEALFGDPSLVHPQRVAETAEEIRASTGQPHSQDAYLGALRGAVKEYLRPGRQRMWHLARRVLAPTLIIYGGADQIVDARTAVRASRTFPNARVVIMAGVGHVAQLEAPRLVERQFRTMVDGG